MNFLEEQLQHKSLNTEQSILMGQWEFDKKNIPMALKAVSSIFPHYSLHDETHSLSILNVVAGDRSVTRGRVSESLYKSSTDTSESF